jgi:Holliday junction DNA helicase RuvB
MSAPQDDRLVSPQNTDNSSAPDSLRPSSLADFIGQGQGLGNLSTFITAARDRGDAMDHSLLHGPPGLGKTTLAQIIAHELGVGFRATSGPVIARAGDLAALLTNLQPRDVLFIDEIHRLNPAVEEVLYPAMEDFQLDLIIGEGPSARSVRIDLPPFTLVGATTRSGLLTTPLRDRFGIQMRMQFYSHDELQVIMTRLASKLGMVLSDDGALEVARRSRGTPRVAGRLLRRVRDIASVAGHKVVDAAAADQALTQLGVDGQGLDAMDRRYLTAMAEHYSGGPVGVDTLAAVLAEQRDVLEEVIEPYLMQTGLLMRTPRGRCLSRAGWDYIGLTPPKGAQLDLLMDPANGDAHD